MKNKICTTIEQSKKLTELGIDVNTADMCYKCIGEDPYDIVFRPYSEWKEEYKGLLVGEEVDVIPAWSLTALLNIIPITCDDGRHCLSLINSNPNGEIEWICCYQDWNGNLMYECYGSSQVDACVEIILKLHELKML